MNIQNTTKSIGFNLSKELAEQTENDLTFGAKKISGIADNVGGIITALYAYGPVVNGVYQRVEYTLNHAVKMISEACKKYLPIGTVQRGRQDWMNCASNAPCNELETQYNYAIQNNLFSPELIDWFRIMNYINPETGLFEISDAFVSIGSGTGPQGNSLKAPLRFIENYGIIPKIMLPDSKDMTFAQYHNPKRITQAMWDLGADFRDKRVDMKYQKKSSVKFGSILGGLRWEEFDSYIDKVDGDFIKKLAVNYKFLHYGYCVKINEIPQPIIEDPNNDMIKLLREIGTEPNRPVYAIANGKKFWLTSWSVVEDFLEPLGYDSLNEAQQSVREVSAQDLKGYINGGSIGNISIIDFMKIMFGGNKKTNEER